MDRSDRRKNKNLASSNHAVAGIDESTSIMIGYTGLNLRPFVSLNKQ
jgi:hypothetical protein